MRFYLFLLCVVLIFSCKDDQEAPVLAEDYGRGMYIVTDLGISYFDYKDSNAVIKNQIYESVNNTSIVNPKSIKLYGNKAYIVGNKIYVVDINTFALEGQVNDFSNSVYCDVIYDNRLLVADRGESLVKVVDLDRFEIIANIETGDSTKPIFIISNSKRSYILNGGRIPVDNKDSTIIAVDHKDGVVPIADLADIVILGDNPNSAVIRGNLKVLCKGVYNSSNPNNNTESSFYKINQFGDMGIIEYTNLAGIYNANNLVISSSGDMCYFTAELGIYEMLQAPMLVSPFLSINSDVLQLNEEKYYTTDSTYIYRDMLYMNDLDNPNKIYKYNLSNSSFEDTLQVNGTVLDIQFKL